MDNSHGYRRPSNTRSSMVLDDNIPEDSKPLGLFPLHAKRTFADTGIMQLKNASQRSQFNPTQSSQLYENTFRSHVDPDRLSTSYRQPLMESEARIAGHSVYSHIPSFLDHTKHNTSKMPHDSNARVKDIRENDYVAGNRASSQTLSVDRQNRSTKGSHYEPSIKEEHEDEVGLSDSHNEDDVGLWMSKLSSNLNQSKNEVVTLRQKNTELRKQLEAKDRLNSEKTQHLLQSRKVSEAFQKNNAELRADLEALGKEKLVIFGFMMEARATMESITQLREEAQPNLQYFVANFEQEGEYTRKSAIMAVANELQSELSKTQQVADILREKLEIMGTELAHARSHVAELESRHGNDIRMIEAVAADISRTTERMVEMDDHLKIHKQDATDTAVELAETQYRLSQLELFSRGTDNLVDSLKQENYKTQRVCDDQKSRLLVLHEGVAFRDQRIQDLETSLLKAQEDRHETQEQMRGLQDRLIVSQRREKAKECEFLSGRVEALETQLIDARDLEKNLSAQNARLGSERDSIHDKCKISELQLADTKRELEQHRTKLSESEVARKILEERFDDQSVTLRITKESIGDIQERLDAALRTNKTLDGKLNILASGRERDESLSKQREVILQLRLDEMLATSVSQQEEIIKLHKEISGSQAKISVYQSHIEEIELRIEESEASRAADKEHIQEKQKTNDYLQSETATLQTQINDLRRRLTVAEAPSEEHRKQLAALNVRIRELDNIVQLAQKRAGTITTRYKEDDLNDDEKALVGTLTQQARAIFERDIMEKNNEIRRHDNLVKQHEARIAQLQDSLQRRIRLDENSNTNGSGNGHAGPWGGPPAPPIKPDQRKANQAPKSAAQSPDSNEGSSYGVLSTSGFERGLPRPAQDIDQFSFRTLAMDAADDIDDFDIPTHVPQNGKRTMMSLGIDDTQDSTRPARRAVCPQETVNDKFTLWGIQKNTVNLPEVETVAEKTPVGPKKRAGRRKAQ
ncbi:hypothetical protein BJ138DRAFT_1127031 [Hygrophoropsis aurantiaca]|uniref:Uncharacterized protein n=1 Tax=Hygrophoropsis aurantiaca TaxID=72124 RepID=A0ACB8AAB7_9AGAM|nr:hypothetical protein BJ138DRAFT_1127031 [Hygrophoropsis aurantiaca]